MNSSSSDLTQVARRTFLKGVLASGAAVGASLGLTSDAQARDNLTLPPEAVGLLFDSTLCVGCKACVAACKRENVERGALPEFNTPEQPYWDTPLDTTGRTFNIIKMYRSGTMQHKDQEKDGYAFMKVSCMHCVDPSCVSACPVSAMTKDAKTGIVGYDKDICIGCRYCVAACPFGIPKYQFDSPTGAIGKCELCRHRMKDGQYAACAEVCPTGATLYGKVKDLKVEADKRLATAPGTRFLFQRGQIDGPDQRWEGEMGTYQKQIYGEKEIGGTQMLKLSGVPFEKMGMPKLPEQSFASQSETLQHTLYGGLVLPIAFVGVLGFIAKRNMKYGEDGGEATEADGTGGGSGARGSTD